jgi:Holliday junction resolvase
MPSKSKAKGNRFEREIVKIAKDRGFESQRAWGSNGQALGMHEEVDLTLGKNPKMKIQAKCRKSIASYLIPTEHVDAVVCKEDRGEPLIIMRFSDGLDMHWGNCMVEDK